MIARRSKTFYEFFASGGMARAGLVQDPAVKRRLCSALAMEDCILNESFIRFAEPYIEEKREPGLPTKKKGSAK